MQLLALLFCALIGGVGLLGLVAPSLYLRVDRYFHSVGWLYAAAAFRLVFGAALFLAAPDSRNPDLLKILGVIVAVAGAAGLLVGYERLRRLLLWWASHGTGFVRGWSLIALLFGSGIGYLLLP